MVGGGEGVAEPGVDVAVRRATRAQPDSLPGHLAYVMAEERDGDHVSAEDQIVQARAALAVPSNADVQLAFDGWTHDRGRTATVRRAMPMPAAVRDDAMRQVASFCERRVLADLRGRQAGGALTDDGFDRRRPCD